MLGLELGLGLGLRVRVRVMVMVRDSKTIFHENYFWWMSNCVFRAKRCLPPVHIYRYEILKECNVNHVGF